MAQQYGLGRGLASLIPQKPTAADAPVTARPPRTASAPAAPAAAPVSAPAAPAGEQVAKLKVADIDPNPHQPRLRFSEDKLGELAQSIKEHGILQPLIVTSASGGRYQLIAGERRLQAAKLAGLAEVPAIVRNAEEQQKFELAIIENVQRHDLNPIEEARAYQKLVDEFNLTQEEVAKKMGKSRSLVANTLRLLGLPAEIQRALMEEKISEGHAKAILSAEQPEKQRAIFELILKNHLTVREAEREAHAFSEKPAARKRSVDPIRLDQEAKLSEHFGTKVSIGRTGQGGRIAIEYYNDEDFTHLAERLMKA